MVFSTIRGLDDRGLIDGTKDLSLFKSPDQNDVTAWGLSGNDNGDDTLTLSLFASGTNDDFDIHPKFGEESDQALL